MNQQQVPPFTADIELRQQVDEEIASDIETELVFVSPTINRIVVRAD